MSSTRTVLNNSTGLQVRKSNKFTAVFVSRARSRLVFNQKGTEHSGQRSRSSFPLFSLHVEPHGDVAEVGRGGAGRHRHGHAPIERGPGAHGGGGAPARRVGDSGRVVIRDVPVVARHAVARD